MKMCLYIGHIVYLEPISNIISSFISFIGSLVFTLMFVFNGFKSLNIVCICRAKRALMFILGV